MQAGPADRAATLMARGGQPITTLARLAARLRVGEAALAAGLDDDPRFHLVHAPPLLTPVDLGGGPADPAYTRAFEAAELAGTCTVLLVDVHPPAGVAGLLASTLSRLADAALPEGALPPVLAAASATVARLPVGIMPGSAAPSTSRPRPAPP